MSTWKEYKIGNALRGHYYFKARSLEEAWRRGCSIFNRGFPARPPGRSICLFQKMYGKPIPTAGAIREKLLGPNAGSWFKAFMEEARQPAEWWQPVASGLSRCKLQPALKP